MVKRLANDESNLNYAVEIPRSLLRILGAWPLSENASTFQKGLKLSQIVACYFLYLFMIIPGFLQIFLKESQLHIRLKILAPLITCITSMTKYSFLLYRSAEIRDGCNIVRRDWKEVSSEENENIMLAKAKIGRKLILLSAAFVYGGGIPFRTVLPLSQGRTLQPDNTTIRTLACPSYFVLFSEQGSPNYEIIFLLQLMAGLMTYTFVCGPCGLAAFFVLHICGQLRILINRLKKLTKGDNLTDEIVRGRIATIVEHHIKTMKFLGKVRVIVEQACLAEIFGSTILVCVTCYCILMEWENKSAASVITYGVLVFSFAFSIFIWSYIGQLLDDERTEMYLASNTVEWYHLPIQQARSLILVIIMSNYAMKITAYKMLDMSLQNFANVMKAAAAYVNMLRSVA